MTSDLDKTYTEDERATFSKTRVCSESTSRNEEWSLEMPKYNMICAQWLSLLFILCFVLILEKCFYRKINTFIRDNQNQWINSFRTQVSFRLHWAWCMYFRNITYCNKIKQKTTKKNSIKTCFHSGFNVQANHINVGNWAP